MAEGRSDFQEEVINIVEDHRLWIRFEKCPSDLSIEKSLTFLLRAVLM